MRVFRIEKEVPILSVNKTREEIAAELKRRLTKDTPLDFEIRMHELTQKISRTHSQANDESIN